jgi:hypothetical protein
VAALACGTVVAKPYLSFARVLADSFHRFHADIPFYVLLADEVDDYFDPAREPFQLVTLSDLEIPHPERFRFHYTQQPLSYASTPYFLAHLLKRGISSVVFIKQESLVLGDLTSLFESLEREAIVLTPHLLDPLVGADRIARELNILQSGTFNVGVLGVADTPVAHRFLAWWQDRVNTHCRHAIAEGIHYEQRWLDLVPALFEGVHVLRDPGYNVGHWNLPERMISVHGDTVLAEGQTCKVFRFSGYSPETPNRVTKYSQRLTTDALGDARFVFDRFRAALEGAGYQETRNWPYAYGAFDNDVPVPDIARLLYIELGDRVGNMGDPFQAGPSTSYFRWLTDSVDGPGSGVTRLWQAVYRARPDLMRAFPDVLGADRDAFLQWTRRFGIDEHSISDRFLAPSTEGLSPA